ncbi:uncharacterized protein LOC122854532 [Aphidius gifuensis]|uniref:uncharacterized protein LOC122854532 n=1 Tax=Aphidius gifuensis TaxID=684658 RepID=UPI001CDCE36D|nr:uncharacterized protein LOC122854532 [Aphidius gifuensis]
MILKLIYTTTLVLVLTNLSSSGIVTYQPSQEDNYHDSHHASVASSFMNFHGPVEGPQYEVKVPYVIPHHNEHNGLHSQEEDDEHPTHGYTLDYFGHPKYEFSYGVEDHHTGDFHQQKEIRDGDSVAGSYSVKEPGGTIRTVTYKADKDGFHAVVHTSGKNDHSGATYTSHNQAPIHQHQSELKLQDNEEQQEEQQQENHYQYSTHEEYE